MDDFNFAAELPDYQIEMAEIAPGVVKIKISQTDAVFPLLEQPMEVIIKRLCANLLLVRSITPVGSGVFLLFIEEAEYADDLEYLLVDDRIDDRARRGFFEETAVDGREQQLGYPDDGW